MVSLKTCSCPAMKISPVFLLLVFIFTSCANGPQWTETESGDLRFVENRGGSTLGYSSTSGVTILEVDGYAFKPQFD